MTHYKFDVVIIGAGPAGVAAAGALAGTGVSVALLDAGVYAGAENWSGCVYFAECLAEKDCFGPEAIEAAPFERRVVRRGTLMHNGLDVVGVELTDANAFRNCYTVLRPVYDPYFAHLARSKGAAHITETTVTSLIRKDGRVIGVETNRGPLYADVTFIAEGDASHLVRSEQLERVTRPHFFQGVKAVLTLRPEAIEKRFKLNPGEGAAYELLIRNASIGGRTARLNVGGFLYTNRDSLSLGYVAPLDNIRNNYRGGHDALFEWVRGLPFIRELVHDASLSAYGTKIIRSGGWRERPILVEDGLVVGGASTGLGVDIPFPNFTGPASATGLYFARAVKNILKRGKTPDAKNLTKEYVAPLRESVYGKNAKYLSAWPGYFGKSKVLFGRTVDIACGAAHFLSSGSLIETGRFLRGHILSFRGIKEIAKDNIRAIGSLRLWKPIMSSTINASTLWRWFANIFTKSPAPDARLGIVLHIAGKEFDATTLPWPVGALIKRLSPALLHALEQIYANNEEPARAKFAEAVQLIVRGMKLTDFIVLPAFGAALFFVALGTAIWDAFRFYVLKTPVEKLLAEPVMAYGESQRRARDLDAVKPPVSLDAKLATNTYRVGSASHIRTLWPESVTAHAEMSQAGLWWICPARVYVYDAPLFGRGKATVNFENCIKCESCWRAEPDRVLWGRHTDHKLVYRPESAAIPVLLNALQTTLPAEKAILGKISAIDEKLWYLSYEIVRACRAALSASAAFGDGVAKLPASADAGRKAWPLALGKRLGEKLSGLEAALSNDNRPGAAQTIQADKKDIELRLTEGRLFHALYCCRRLDRRVSAWIDDAKQRSPLHVEQKDDNLSSEEVSKLFPDRIVKEWEDKPIPHEWAEKLRAFIVEYQDTPQEAVRALSFVSPALGLIALHQLSALRTLTKTGTVAEPGLCAVTSDIIDIEESSDSVRIRGVLGLAPVAACKTLLVISRGKGHIIPLSTPGVTVTPTPAIGFRAAGLSDITLDCAVKKDAIIATQQESVPDPASYLAIALGAGDYLSKRVKEHAVGRVQFPGQMLDTEGRDGIAKLGAVKAMIGRVEAWRLLLQSLYETVPNSAIRKPQSAIDFDLLCATLAATAFGPEPGAMGYDAGQVFGGFAYSEDDLLSRSYRDSSLFRFLVPGHGAPAKLRAALGSRDLGKAIPALGSLDAVRGEPLGRLASRLTSVIGSCHALPPAADPALVGNAEAITLGIRGLLASIERGLNEGRSMEAEAAAAETMLGLAETAVMKAAMSAGSGAVSPSAVFPVEPSGNQVKLEPDYETFCAMPGPPHTSGSFLGTPFDRAPRFVPEMQLHDAKLRARWTELVEWFKKNCHDKKFDGLDIERAIEKIHMLPAEIVAAVKENKWLATYIPKSEDGLGWKKAEYYILNSAAGSFGDAGINLLIMASTSIGTTPILLGLEDELPRVREELDPLARDEQKLGELHARLSKIIKSLANPNPAWIKKEYESVMKLVDARIRHTRVVKYLAANFLRAFYGAGIAGRRGDFGGFITNLKRAGELFTNLMPDVRAALDELPRRERCHKLYLRYLGHGGVSAFALTEPTAGSDSGGVKTTAKVQRVKLTLLEDGRYSFRLDEKDDASARYLIDADRIVFTNRGIAYQTPDGQTAEIRYDKYDYATDLGVRHYLYKGKECPFHDIGQVRKTDAGLVYEFYTVTGAKMWITNGSIATQFCLYAQTPEGVTGFMVDRHAEGLKVGADEKKTGQRGSPTNEISLDSVRVPREAVIGYEGHGQVNALETLNVGRCGLAVVSGALMRKLMHEANRSAPESPERDMLLGEAAAIQFGSESLAYYLVGLFDRPHESVRMESAIAKYACSEDIHELITLVERAHGPAGQTEKYLLEKARRDSRILTIYEGTNEVQRFLILKDLIAQAARWPELPSPQDGPAARTLADWKNRLRLHVKNAAALLGDASWSDAMLQPAMFPLAEMAGEILRLDCIYYRVEWLTERKALLGEAYAGPLLKAGSRAAQRTIAQLTHLDRVYALAWDLVRKNIDAPEVQAADAALDGVSEKAWPAREPETPLRAPLRVLCIVRPVADLSPAPRLSNGEIQEIIWKPDPLDREGLAQALGLKTKNPALVSVDALMAGPARHEHILLACAGAAADRLIRLHAEQTEPKALADAVRTLELLRQYDLIITGSSCLNGDRSIGAYLAGNLKRTHYRRERIRIRPDGMGLERTAAPAVIDITAAGTEPASDISTAVASMFTPVTVMKPSAKSAMAAPRFEPPAGTKAETKIFTSVADTADFLKAYASAESSGKMEAYKGEVGPGRLVDGGSIWAMLDPREQKSNFAALRASRRIADLLHHRVCAIIPAPKDLWPALLGAARAQGADRAVCMDTGSGMLSIEGKKEALRLILKTSNAPIVAAGGRWIDAFGLVAGEASLAGRSVRFYGSVSGIIGQSNSVMLSSLAYDNRLVRNEALAQEAVFMTVPQDAEFPVASKRDDFVAGALDLAIGAEWLMALPPESGPSLSQAEVIIDLGYGIKDRSGFELAQKLKDKLEAMGLAPMFGATRKVTQDLKLLPLDAQIGQTGVRVSPKLIIALGISGAPQHIDYLGARAEILCFNKDAEAPLMKLNQTRPSPRVHPIAGDLFVTVRELIEKLG